MVLVMARELCGCRTNRFISEIGKTINSMDSAHISSKEANVLKDSSKKITNTVKEPIIILMVMFIRVSG